MCLECTLTTIQCCSLHKIECVRGRFHFDGVFYSFSLRTISNSPSFKDKGFIVSSAAVQWGVCIGFRAGLPSSVFLSEIFEWDQTVIRSKLAQKHTQAHVVVHMHVHRHTTLSNLQPGCKWAAGRGGFTEMELLLWMGPHQRRRAETALSSDVKWNSPFSWPTVSMPPPFVLGS